ncbi:SDR family NAD(P)-dependent oxidoreductase [Gordonia sp. C13]|uniref:SDR family NAD(P)-dependent oxidoreductase n=1 Tax=Gordonia sp. C13 TaxID=2935078 RepID=UPI00200A5945|nr:SDR family oxidoreductase [Gordonia sp. C13]MCK8613965.1 SDR family oxidoreductase [Gordonia sp. C13]
MTDWSNKKVLVTGASRGIGVGIAAAFARAGARVAITGRGRDALIRAQRSLSEQTGATCEIIETDVAEPDSCRKMADQVESLFGGLDVLCANAGVYPEKLLDQIRPDDVARIFAINTFGTIFSTQACTPLLSASGHGRIVLTSSITGPTTGYAGLSHYGASKAAQLGFMRSAALEFARSSITINAILPGSIRTEGLSGLGEAAIARMIETIPCGRLGEIGDIGAAALFLASEEASFITGQTLTVDGGQTLPEHADAF